MSEAYLGKLCLYLRSPNWLPSTMLHKSAYLDASVRELGEIVKPDFRLLFRSAGSSAMDG